MPRWSWFVSSSWFSMTTLRPVPDSWAYMSTLKEPTGDSVSMNSSSMPTAAPRDERFASSASHLVKSRGSLG